MQKSSEKNIEICWINFVRRLTISSVSTRTHNAHSGCRKKKKLLRDFNPYGASVHPLSRPRPKEPSISSGDEYASEDSEEVDQLEESDELEKSDQLDESESSLDDFVPPTRVRQLRSARRLPFSPAKAPTKRRLRRRAQPSDSDDEIVTTRRSTRSTRNTKSYQVDDEYEDEEPDGSDVLSAPKKKKRVRAKASRPAYGHFREVADLELDDQSDDETLPLRAHRDECEKCHHPPSHILLKKLERRHRNKRSSDSNEEDEDERDNLESLGGWIRWWVPVPPLSSCPLD